MRKIQLIEVKSEIGAGTRGASLGIDAIKIAALDFRSNFFLKYPALEVKNENQLLHASFISPHAKRIKGVATMYERVANEVKNTLEDDKFPVILSGDHSTSGGTIAGIRMAYPDKKLGVIWVDAHADLHSPYTTPSGNLHGMPLAVSLGIDNKEAQVNNPSQDTIDRWEELKNLGGIYPKILPEDLIFLGLRDYEPEEEQIIRKHSIKYITVKQIRKKGIDKTCRSVLEYLKHVDMLYISFDVDVMDAGISKGTGTPVTNGLNEREVANIILGLVQNTKICCFELTEVNPTLDTENLMAENAFEILQRVTVQLEID